MRETRTLAVPDGLAGMRVDAGLARLLGLSRTTVATLVDAGDVLVDGRPAIRSERLVADAGLQITLPEPPRAPVTAPMTVDGLTIIYRDADIAVIDKPVGVAAHASPGWTGPTVTGALAGLGIQAATSGASERQGIVHRLDAGTSGVMVTALSEHAYTVLKDAFRERTVDKVYSALVQGHPDPSSGTIDAPIGRHPTADWKFAVVAGGRDSVTHYDTDEAFRAASLLTVHLETGRTHQIRVHFSALHHPCVGDLTYGADPVLAKRVGLTRQWLHARSLAFAHPADGRRVEFTSPYPADLEHALEVVRDSS
ncbi:RluA family pseudouridine synthase [Nakamurella flavida]|uniref:Pseudouridine synthase n=1 Tax=Nakamurella flavida TaxID=363630 RepID=A0A939C5E4_9ACTN|nr:RluA family pseudouridine synthase [Nakamurella flavida]MBM9476102.1 RluA family pseudouridine synthase [Nakamurella flavida]MDP9777153.1 23S rRNA pseudouridine1911/1915/1917 synthase [Nakamurella flavida]